jgi:hypothetical protein
MQATVGVPITTTLLAPGGLTGLGARIEVPVTRAIASGFVPASLVGGLWLVTVDAPVAAGDYLLVWRTSDPEPPTFEAFLPLIVAAAGASNGAAATLDDITPSVDDVAALLQERTKGAGVYQGTFNDKTRPTAEQVEHFCAMAAADVNLRLGNDRLPVDRDGDIRRLAAYQAAALVEASYWPDSDSPARAQYSAIYLAGMAALGRRNRVFIV